MLHLLSLQNPCGTGRASVSQFCVSLLKRQKGTSARESSESGRLPHALNHAGHSVAIQKGGEAFLCEAYSHTLLSHQHPVSLYVPEATKPAHPSHML